MHFYSLYLVVSHFLSAPIKQLLFIIMVMVGVVNTFTLEINAFVKLNSVKAEL